MLKVDRRARTFERLKAISLSEANVQERYDLQEWIVNSAEIFFQEIAEDIFIVAKEICPSDKVADRIDILAVDKKGQSVVIELKRDNSKWHLLQALSYAAMLSTWDRAKFGQVMSESSRERFDDFLGDIDGELNNAQRVVLIAEAFDYEVLATADWLTNWYGLNIACYRIALVCDPTHESEYLSCVQVFPPKEFAAEVVRRGAARVASLRKKKSLAERLKDCKNPAVVNFVNSRLEKGQRLNSARYSLIYPQEGKMRWRIRVRASYAGVIQLGRFVEDEQLWSDSLSEPNLSVRSNNELGFRLKTERDFSFFQQIMDERADDFRWIASAVANEESDEDEDL